MTNSWYLWAPCIFCHAKAGWQEYIRLISSWLQLMSYLNPSAHSGLSNNVKFSSLLQLCVGNLQLVPEALQEVAAQAQAKLQSSLLPSQLACPPLLLHSDDLYQQAARSAVSLQFMLLHP